MPIYTINWTDPVLHSVSPKYLQTYVNEFAYRYNRRNDVMPLFKSMIQKVLMLV